MNETYPLSDEYMRYDYTLHRYVLTQKYITEIVGIDLERRVASNQGINGVAVIESALKTISMQIYSYIYKFNDRNVLTWLLAKAPSAREILKEAMGIQARYLFSVGDMSLTLDDKRAMILSPLAEELLKNSELAETGAVITSVAPYNICVPSYEQGRY